MSFNLNSDLEIEELKNRIRDLENEVKILKAPDEIQSVMDNKGKEEFCPECGCNKIDVGGYDKVCLNILCEWRQAK